MPELKHLLRKLAKLLVANSTSTSNAHAWCSVVCTDVPEEGISMLVTAEWCSHMCRSDVDRGSLFEVLLGDGHDVFLWSKNGAAQRGALCGQVRQERAEDGQPSTW